MTHPGGNQICRLLQELPSCQSLCICFSRLKFFIVYKNFTIFVKFSSTSQLFILEIKFADFYNRPEQTSKSGLVVPIFEVAFLIHIKFYMFLQHFYNFVKFSSTLRGSPTPVSHFTKEPWKIIKSESLVPLKDLISRVFVWVRTSNKQ